MNDSITAQIYKLRTVGKIDNYRVMGRLKLLYLPYLFSDKKLCDELFY